MLTQEDKQKIYQCLKDNLEQEVAYPMARVAGLLNREKLGNREFGYPKIKPFMAELSEFVSVKEIVLGQNPQQEITLHAWEPAAEGGKAKKQTEQPEPQEPQEKKAAAPLAITEADQKAIYQTLVAVFPLEQPIHMATISKLLNDEGFAKERFGYAKMKPMLQELSYLSMEEVPMNGVSQVLITIHPVTSWQEGVTEAEEKSEAAEQPFDLPRQIDHEVYFPPRTLAMFNQEVSGTMAQPGQALRDTICQDYAQALQSGQIRSRSGAYVFNLSVKDMAGNAMIASIKRSDRPEGLRWFLNYAGSDRTNPGKMLEHFAFLGSWTTFLEELAKKALPEKWEFEGKNSRPNEILKQYIQYTFYRLQLEDKICISDDHSFAAFNTGLVSRHYDDIFACFEATTDDQYSTQWRFIEFCTAGGRGTGKRVVDCFNPLPQPASYFERKEDLLFDLEKELHTDYDHILLDNLSRLPLDFVREECHGMYEALEIIEDIEKAEEYWQKKRHYQELSDLIADTPRLFNRLRNRIEDAIELAKKQIRWNFKTAIPCFFPTRNVMSLMLPLSLREDNQADAGLVVELTRSGNYQGQTILTLQQAYLDARLLCRPNSEWLDVHCIKAEENEYE